MQSIVTMVEKTVERPPDSEARTDGLDRVRIANEAISANTNKVKIMHTNNSGETQFLQGLTAMLTETHPAVTTRFDVRDDTGTNQFTIYGRAQEYPVDLGQPIPVKDGWDIMVSVNNPLPVSKTFNVSGFVRGPGDR